MANIDSERELDNQNEGEERDDRYILVVGFTRQTAYQFLRIRQNREGSIYVEFAYRGRNPTPHYSYHASGEAHTVYVDQNGRRLTTNITQVMPVAEFRGEYNLGVWVVVSPDFPVWRELTTTADGRTQALFCFDMSNWVLGQQLSINCTLVESGRVDLLSRMVSEFPENLHPQTLVITTTEPWIVVRATPV